MAETVKVPGIKEPLPKTAVFAGVAITGVLIIVYYRKQKSAAAGTTSTTGLASGAGGGLLAGDTSGAYPWDGTYGNPSDPYSLDSTTGQTYGNEGYFGGFGVQGGGGSGGGGGVSGPPFSNNSAWSAYALQQLTQTASFNPNNVAESLGLYLEGKTLNANQQNIIYAAIGVAGPVPVNGSGGFPPKLRTKQGTGHKGGKQFADNPVKGLKVTVKPGPTLVTGIVGSGVFTSGKDDLEISWDKSEHATGYQISIANVTAHRTALSPRTTVHTSYTARNLERKAEFEVTVLAKPAEKGAQAAKTRVKT